MERDFLAAQQRMLDRSAVRARSIFVDISSIGGKAHALIAGEGPPVVMVSGIGTPGAMWAPLMAQLQGFQLFAVDLPAYGLTGTTSRFAENLRRNAAVARASRAIEQDGRRTPARAGVD
jgi:pimeloyl-ACP methyl ester carboxylesterase